MSVPAGAVVVPAKLPVAQDKPKLQHAVTVFTAHVQLTPNTPTGSERLIARNDDQENHTITSRRHSPSLLVSDNGIQENPWLPEYGSVASCGVDTHAISFGSTTGAPAAAYPAADCDTPHCCGETCCEADTMELLPLLQACGFGKSSGSLTTVLRCWVCLWVGFVTCHGWTWECMSVCVSSGY